MSPQKEDNNIPRFNDYMMKQWINIDMIHMSRYGHRLWTNNVGENWHMKMNNRIFRSTNLLFSTHTTVKTKSLSTPY